MYPLAILIGGPTATQKTRLAYEIQKKLPSIIINSDSMQVYKDLASLTNAPSNEEIREYSCKLFKFMEYPEKCNVGLWFTNVLKVLSQTKEKIPIFVGGTGLYLESLYGKISAIPEIPVRVETKIKKLHKKHGNSVFFRKLEQVDEIYSKKISRNDTQRLLRAITVKIATGKNLTYWHGKVSKKVFKKIIYLTISVDRGKLYKSIDDRCLKIMKSNAVNEVSRFLKKKKKIDHPLHKSIGFKVIEDYLMGIKSFKESLDLFRQETRRYAKRQITWFRNRPKEAIEMNFSDAKKYLLKNI